MSEYRFEIAERDEAFIKGMRDDYVASPGTRIKARKGEPYILHVNSDHIIPIINAEDRWFYSKLYAVTTTAIGGSYGVYADNEEEALHLFADHCAEQIPDPDNEGQTKMRYPGLVWSLHDIIEEEGEKYLDWNEFDGPYGNEDWYFTERGQRATTEEVHDPKIPPIPDDLFPYSLTYQQAYGMQPAIDDTWWQLIRDIGHRYGKHAWAVFLQDYVNDNRDKLFKHRISEEEHMIWKVTINLVE